MEHRVGRRGLFTKLSRWGHKYETGRRLEWYTASESEEMVSAPKSNALLRRIVPMYTLGIKRRRGNHGVVFATDPYNNLVGNGVCPDQRRVFDRDHHHGQRRNESDSNHGSQKTFASDSEVLEEMGMQAPAYNRSWLGQLKYVYIQLAMKV